MEAVIDKAEKHRIKEQTLRPEGLTFDELRQLRLEWNTLEGRAKRDYADYVAERHGPYGWLPTLTVYGPEGTYDDGYGGASTAEFLLSSTKLLGQRQPGEFCFEARQSFDEHLEEERKEIVDWLIINKNSDGLLGLFTTPEQLHDDYPELTEWLAETDKIVEVYSLMQRDIATA